MSSIILVEADQFLREFGTTSIEYARGVDECVATLNPADAMQYIDRKDIVGVICALNFAQCVVISGVTGLAKECKARGRPFIVCISRKNDKPSKNQLEILDSLGIKYTIAEDGDKDFEGAVKKLGLKL